MREKILGVPVDFLTKEETLELITGLLNNRSEKSKMLVTAYSEFFVAAHEDSVFKDILRKSDIVTPDGNSVLAAREYLRMTKGKSLLSKIFSGLDVGGRILKSNMGETVTGVWLFETLTSHASKNDWKIFLLGGWDGVASRAAKRLLERFPDIKVECDEGEKRVGGDLNKNSEVIAKINKFSPDILFVQYNPVKQEKWIASHLDKLKVGLAIGVGGTFNEYLGEFRKAPITFEKMGLKWLWRLMMEPRRFKRIFKAVVVFPWLVFKESLGLEYK